MANRHFKIGTEQRQRASIENNERHTRVYMHIYMRVYVYIYVRALLYIGLRDVY